MSVLWMRTDGDTGVKEFGVYDISAMSSAWYSIIHEELHDDVDSSLRAIRNVLSRTLGVSVLVDSPRRATAIVASMPSSSRLGLIHAVVSSGEVECIAPLQGLGGLHLLEEGNGFSECTGAFSGSHTNLTRDSENVSIELPKPHLQLLNEVLGRLADFVL